MENSGPRRQTGHCKGETYRVGFPRSDPHVTVGAVTVRPTLALCSWVALKQPGDSTAMLMGDVVLHTSSTSISRRGVTRKLWPRRFTQGLRRDPVHDLHDERSIETVAQRAHRREAVARRGIGAVAGIPHEIHVVSDHRDPVKPHVEVHAVLLVRVLHKGEQTGARVEIVLEAARCLRGGEAAAGE